MKKTVFILVVFIGICLLVQPVAAQPRTHTVVKGDTLWDLCAYYYGDSTLWPKLWEMNPFVTNPHLLKPGDTITLLEGVPLRAGLAEGEGPEKKSAARPAPDMAGVDVSGLTNVDAIGFFSSREVTPLGHIVSDVKDRVLLAEGDTVFVKMYGEENGRVGSEFTVYERSGVFKDPQTGKRQGHVITYLGRVALREHLPSGLWRAEIRESYGGIVPGAPLITYQPVSSCVLPVPATQEVETRIVAVKELREIIGQFTVVYLGLGFSQGVRRGNVFEVVTHRKVAGLKRDEGPEVAMGHLLILEARPNTATGVVMSSDRDLYRNIAVRSVDWPRAKQAVSGLPACRVD